MTRELIDSNRELLRKNLGIAGEDLGTKRVSRGKQTVIDEVLGLSNNHRVVVTRIIM